MNWFIISFPDGKLTLTLTYDDCVVDELSMTGFFDYATLVACG